MKQHLLTLADLDVAEIDALLNRAQQWSDGAAIPALNGRIAANLFFEPSTRTQYSFNIAEEKLGMRVVSFHPGSSSLNKEESFYDTVKTIDSMGVDALVIRHVENEYYRQLVGHVDAAILNGGDGTGNHPTQSLLDLLTIRQEFGGFSGLKVAIAGDIRHSRVAHTNIEIMRRLGMHVVICGPDLYLEPICEIEPLDEAVRTSDIVMMLRVQHERHDITASFTKDEYLRAFGLTAARAARMKERAIIMHPAPFNRGVEIEDAVVECPRSRIFRQVRNGVFVRMAALCRAIGGL